MNSNVTTTTSATMASTITPEVTPTTTATIAEPSETDQYTINTLYKIYKNIKISFFFLGHCHKNKAFIYSGGDYESRRLYYKRHAI